MTLIIEIKNKVVTLFLKKGNGLVDKASFPEENNLSRELLASIDKLLKANKLKPIDIKSVNIKTDTPTGFTTSRIARTISKGWNWAVCNM